MLITDAQDFFLIVALIFLLLLNASSGPVAKTSDYQQ
jgi:hypothetical protein